MISGIFACDQNNGIGVGNTLPWRSSKDLKYFMNLTVGSTVVMGRKTWDSLPKKPLPDRTNIIISSRHNHYWTLEQVKEYLHSSPDVFIIGGANIFQKLEKYIEKWYITRVTGNYRCDTFFKPDLSNFTKVSSTLEKEGELGLNFEKWKKSARLLQKVNKFDK